MQPAWWRRPDELECHPTLPLTLLVEELGCRPSRAAERASTGPTLLLQAEELDYGRERDNLLKFAALYGPGRGRV